MLHNPFSPIKLMEMAVDVMGTSVAEGRIDKVSPKVGAVLVKLSDETIVTASRGELRNGDHAEYTILERKSRDKQLDDALLFVTLEPCAPGSRTPPKLSCADRIINARIKEVWIGIEDPDPLVARKGIKHLQDNGVTVHMFDADLQLVISKENRAFLDGAIERSEKAKLEPESVVLSPFETVVQIESQLSEKALNVYRERAGVAEPIGSEAFNRHLVSQGVLTRQGNEFVPTGFGEILFGETQPLQARVLATAHRADGRETIKTFDGPQSLVIEAAMEWLREIYLGSIDRSQAVRRETNEGFYTLIREGLGNALVHRDYEIEGAKIQLVATGDKIEVKSPGRPVEPITIEQMEQFAAPALSRNPVMHSVFARMRLAEERGLGLKSMKAQAGRAGLPQPRYSWQEPYLVLTVYRTSESAAHDLVPDVLEQLDTDEKNGMVWMSTQREVRSKDYIDALGFDERKAQRHLKHFVELGLVERSGKTRNTLYRWVAERR